MDEVVLDSFSGSKRVGFMKYDHWVFVFTNYRILVNIIPSEIYSKAIYTNSVYFDVMENISYMTKKGEGFGHEASGYISRKPRQFHY